MNSKLIAYTLVVLVVASTSMAATPEYCAYEKVEGICQGRFDRYYYEPATGTCELFQYGGCQGNENNFETQIECEAVCVPVA
ncbi:hypothetical protein BsWGS_07373 [Bradybaena similaris]